MLHPIRFVPFMALGVLLLATQPALGQLLSEDFESYKLGSLDKNDPLGPNQADNGSGNPWFGPEVSHANGIVVGPENGVNPISGNQMLRGRVPSAISQNWFNLAYRLNNGTPFMENVVLGWWFYDPLGQGGTDFRDYVALGFYDTAPPDTDAPDNYNLNVGFTQIQRLSLGATLNDGSDSNYYQARVVFAMDGYNPNGWFNTSMPRSVGWHQAAIMIGPMLDDGTNDVAFFIDDMENPILVHNSETTFGYNVIEINASFGLATGYFDDISFDSLN